jgi:hypothetical protein
VLDLAGRSEVPVVAGTALAGTPPTVIRAPESVPAQPAGVLDAVLRAVEQNPEPVRWLGIGAMTNLALVLRATAAGRLGARLRIDPALLRGRRCSSTTMAGSSRGSIPNRWSTTRSRSRRSWASRSSPSRTRRSRWTPSAG